MPHIAPWFFESKFGIFVHWLLRSHTEEPQNRKYSEHPTQASLFEDALSDASQFTADQFDAKAWAKLFKSWGAKYSVLTTKHHIGFALFDTDKSMFTAKKSSPAKRDLVKEFAEAMRSEGLKVGLYYSFPDWSHPDYPTLSGGQCPYKYSDVDMPDRWKKFLELMFYEIEHLCTAYGKIDLLWFDGDWERSAEQWKVVELAERIEKLQPGIVINNRMRHRCLGHYGTPESTYPITAPEGFWEFCGTPGDNWDYQGGNKNIKPVNELIRCFGDMIGMGGNVLLNVAPHANGTIPQVQINALSGLGEFVTKYSEAIYGAERGLPPGLFNGASTRRGSVLYLISYDRPYAEWVVKGLNSKVIRATDLSTGNELAFRYSGGRKDFGQLGWLWIKVPDHLHHSQASVIRLEFENDILEYAGQRFRGRPQLLEKAVSDTR